MSYGQGPVVFPNMDALLKVSNNMPVGTMAYVADQELVGTKNIVLRSAQQRVNTVDSD